MVDVEELVELGGADGKDGELLAPLLEELLIAAVSVLDIKSSPYT